MNAGRSQRDNTKHEAQERQEGVLFCSVIGFRDRDGCLRCHDLTSKNRPDAYVDRHMLQRPRLFAKKNVRTWGSGIIPVNIESKAIKTYLLRSLTSFIGPQLRLLLASL